MQNSLIKSIVYKKESVSTTAFENMKSSLDRLCSDSSILNCNDELKVSLTYPVRSFLNDVMAACASLSQTERNKVTSYFGFEIIEEDFLILDGFPAISENLNELRAIKDRASKMAVAEVRKLVRKFVCENKIICENNTCFEKELNIICETFPEFFTLIGRVQHGVHDYTLDIHILKVFAHVLDYPGFDELSDLNKRILLVAVLLHDLTKAENKIDKNHPLQSAYAADMILEKTPVSSEQKKKIFIIIKNHDFLEKYNKKWSTPQEIAEAFTDKELFEMCCILTVADLKSVKADGSFYERNYPVLLEAKSKILPLFE